MGMDLAYSGARSAYVHSGVAKKLVVDFKAGGQPVLAPLMASLAAPAFRDLVVRASGGAGPVLVTWVPSHPAAQRERGYNQAELLARALAAGGVTRTWTGSSSGAGVAQTARPPLAGGPAPLPTAGLTRKPRRTKHQKALGRAGRQGNLRGAFVIDEKALHSLGFAPKALVLVDDVFTTGATTQEVSAALHAGTGAPVYVFTFSRAVASRVEGHD